MALPNIDEFLESLYRMKRENALAISAAESRGDLREARALQLNIKRINAMIEKKGGDLNA